MTEIERIISKGVIPGSFIEPETRCEYLVSEKVKKIWAIEIDLYLEFVRVCRKYNLRFYALGGTILGAVRHGGYIPWDDDLDVGMPREDYNKLFEIGPKEFQNPYFLQNPYTDPGYYVSFAKLRNSNTASISMPFKNAGFNQGIAIDIFPIDYADPETYQEDFEKVYECIMKCSSYMKVGSETQLNSRQMENFKKFRTDNPMGEYEKLQKIISRYGKTPYMALSVTTVYPFPRLIWPSECFDSVVEMPYETIEVVLPSGYDRILTQSFGDYMKFPPIEKRGNWHSGVYWDPDNSYEIYKDPIRGGWNDLIINTLR